LSAAAELPPRGVCPVWEEDAPEEAAGVLSAAGMPCPQEDKHRTAARHRAATLAVWIAARSDICCKHLSHKTLAGRRRGPQSRCFYRLIVVRVSEKNRGCIQDAQTLRKIKKPIDKSHIKKLYLERKDRRTQPIFLTPQNAESDETTENQTNRALLFMPLYTER